MQAFPFDSELTFDEHDNPIYDRAVSSQPLRKLIKELFTTGVMPNPSTNFQVSAGSDGMTVQVKGGFAVIDGGLCQETEVRTLEVTAADNTYDRIDTVVLRWNENVDVRTADLYVVAGTPAVNPVRPTLQRNNSIYEIGLADVFITKRVATITTDKITDTRYEAERCGIVSSISEFDTTTLYQQIQADLAGFKSTEQAKFMSWFANIQNILDENAAGHLQNEIDNLDGRLGTFEEAIENYTNGLGNTSIKNIGNGTLTGAISKLNTDKISKYTDNDYVSITSLGFNPTTEELGVMIGGADSVIPFSSKLKLERLPYTNNMYVPVERGRMYVGTFKRGIMAWSGYRVIWSLGGVDFIIATADYITGSHSGDDSGYDSFVREIYKFNFKGLLVNGEEKS